MTTPTEIANFLEQESVIWRETASHWNKLIKADATEKAVIFECAAKMVRNHNASNMPHESTVAAIQGAIACGVRGVNEPQQNSWLMEFWLIGRNIATTMSLIESLLENENKLLQSIKPKEKVH